MESEIHRLQSINGALSDDPTNSEFVLQKLRILQELSRFTRIDLDELRSLRVNLPEFKGYHTNFYHAWGVLDTLSVLHEKHEKYNNFHVSVIGNQIVKIQNISTKYSEMNPKSFYYIGVVFGKQLNVRSPYWITEQQKNKLNQEVQTTYGHLFNFPEATEQFITKSLVGIEECCPICGSDEDLKTCVAVRDGKCVHSFHRVCIKKWFAQCGRRICPFCKQDHDK